MLELPEERGRVRGLPTQGDMEERQTEAGRR